MNNFNYEANQSNIDRMISIQRQKINHLKMLHTIYNKNQYPTIRQQHQLLKQRQRRLNNKIFDMQRRHHQLKSQINHENTILRNKLINIYLSKNKNNQLHKNTKTQLSIFSDLCLDSNDKRKLEQSLEESKGSKSKLKGSSSNVNTQNSRKIELERELHQTNAKFFMKLSSIKSQVMPKLNLKQHNKQSSYLRQMIMKKSPQKQLRFKKIVSRNITQRTRVNEQYLNSSFRQTNPRTNNPQEQFIFY